MNGGNDPHIKNWKEFSLLADRLSAAHSFLFRGQSDATWALNSSLTRILNDYQINREDALEVEKTALQSFREKTKHIPGLEAYRDHTDEPKWQMLWWEIMQHHQSPTRLLDWSESPYVALFFAVSDNPEEDGSFYCFNDGHLNFIRKNRRGVAWPDIDLQIELSSRGQPYEKSIYAFSSKVPIDRKINQKGCYTISTEVCENFDETHDRLADKLMFEGVHGANGMSIVKRYVINKRLKPIFLGQLCSEMGISRSYIYPDTGRDDGQLDKISKSVRDGILARVKEIGSGT